MLRAIIGAVAIAFVVLALTMTAMDRAAWPMLAAALLLAFGCLYERRYHAGRSGQAPGDGFRATGERFVDPESGLLTTVWTDPATGERRYVADGQPSVPHP